MSNLLVTLNQFSMIVCGQLLWASVIGGLAIFIALSLTRQNILPAAVNCWVLRLAILKLLLVALWVSPIEFAVLENASTAQAQAPSLPPVQRLENMGPEANVNRAGSWLAPAEKSETTEKQIAAALPVAEFNGAFPSLFTCLASLWCIGVLVQGGRLLRDSLRLAQIRRSSQLISDSHITSALQRISGQMGVRRPKLRWQSEIASPFLIGSISPTILVPTSLISKCNDRTLSDVFAHELAHIRRHDLVWNWLATLAAVTFYFHPLNWLLLREWQEQAEAAADEIALEVTHSSPAQYGASMIRFLDESLAASGLLVGYGTSYRRLHKRLRSLGKAVQLSLPQRCLIVLGTVLIAVFGLVPWKLTAAVAMPQEASKPSVVQAQESGRTLLISVTDGKAPIPGASVFRNHVFSRDGNQPTIENETYTTDSSGQAAVALSGTSVDLRIWVRMNGYVPLHAMWAKNFQSDGDQIPVEFTFVMQAGTEIGGIVVDQFGKPIEGAVVEVRDPLAGLIDGPSTRPGRRPVRAGWLAEDDTAVVTDAQGGWSINTVPLNEQLITEMNLQQTTAENRKHNRPTLDIQVRLPKASNPAQVKPKGEPKMHGGIPLDALRLKTARLVMQVASSQMIAQESAADRLKTLKETPDSASNLRHLYFVLAEHAILHVDGEDVRVINIGELITLIERTAESSVVYPHFSSTEAGREKEEKVNRFFWPLYKKLYAQKKMTGSSWGFLSPAAYKRWDNIRTAEDLQPIEDKLRRGRVVTSLGAPIEAAEIILLPEERSHGVYLRDGRVRNALEENLTRSNLDGNFEIAVDQETFWIVAMHPSGFSMQRISEMKEAEWNLQLKPWARVVGNVNDPVRHKDLKLSEYPVSMTIRPVPKISFHIYETAMEADGTFDQKFVPPGNVHVSRAFELDSGSMSFPEASFWLAAGESRKAGFVEVTDEMRRQINAANKRWEEFQKQQR